MNNGAVQSSLLKRKYWHIIFPLFLISVLAYLDRTNIAYAALTMNKDLAFTAQVFGMGAGIFFGGYLIFEIPGALISNKYSPRWWLARIMITWGLVCGLMGSMTTATEFYIYRFSGRCGSKSISSSLCGSHSPLVHCRRTSAGYLSYVNVYSGSADYRIPFGWFLD